MLEKRLSVFGFVMFSLFIFVTIGVKNAGSLEYIQILLVFAYGVLVPIGLDLAHTRRTGWYINLLYLHPVALVFAAGSFLIEPGILSTILSLLWFIFTTLISSYGLWSFLYHKAWTRVYEAVIHMGMMYVVIGGFWLTLHRTGKHVLHFPDLIVLLTSIHFHYAAFGTLIVFGVLGQRIYFPHAVSERLFKLSAGAMIAGPMLVAIGITYGPSLPWLEFGSVILFVVPIVSAALLTLRYYVPMMQDAIAKPLIIIGCLSLFVSMAFAFLYGYEAIGSLSFVLGIPLMVFVHGMVNAFGFSFCMLAGLYIEEKRQ
ncbi:YndJ family protein [Pontibacillus salicampi]|uniref:YndJ family protein n=1 Tax=Pontibacillus salicampi TaxID=1449801 RepID=A0ABV6LTK8_9BACI